MNCASQLRIGAWAVLLMSSTAGLENARADDGDLRLNATERGVKGVLPPNFGEGAYVYRPEEFYIHGVEPATRFGKLRVGNALPVLGTIYRVRRADERELVLQFIPEKDLPEDCRLREGSLAFPLKSIGRLRGSEIIVDEIAEVDGKPTAKILGVHRAGALSGNYRRGDSLNVEGWLYRVVNVVAPRKGYEGWIELDGVALPGPPAPNPNLEIKVSATGLEIFRDNKRGQAVAFVDEPHRKAMTDFIAEHKGWTIAFQGQAYRVAEVDDTAIRCTLVPWKEFAPEAEARPGNALLPAEALLNLNGWSFRITAIEGEGAERIARFEGIGEAKEKLGSYKIGELITTNGFARRVVNIVASNKARKLIGWVELSPAESGPK